jgi:hypothetical protein
LPQNIFWTFPSIASLFRARGEPLMKWKKPSMHTLVTILLSLAMAGAGMAVNLGKESGEQSLVHESATLIGLNSR